MNKRETLDGFIYFIRCAVTGAVKIGFTASNPRVRLSALQTGNPFPLDLLLVIDGNRYWEAYFHERFADERLKGEWFTLEGPVAAWADECRNFHRQRFGCEGSPLHYQPALYCQGVA